MYLDGCLVAFIQLLVTAAQKDMEQIPQYYELLTDEDKEDYIRLREKLAMPEFSNQRGRSKNTFVAALELTRKYVNKSDVDSLKRSLVCGITWLSNGLAVNIQQMKLLMSKCKSSINNSFGLQGYETIPSGVDSAKELIVMFPFLKNNFSELRKWTIRKKDKGVTMPVQSEIYQSTSPKLEFSIDAMDIPFATSVFQDRSFDQITPPEVDIPVSSIGDSLDPFSTRDILFDLDL